MISRNDDPSDIVLYCAGESLLSQVARHMPDHQYCLRLVSAASCAEPDALPGFAAFSIIDATDHPAAAMAALEHALDLIDPDLLTVYTERMHTGLELFVRLRGVIMLLGPMSQQEWTSFFETVGRNHLRLAQSGYSTGRADFACEGEGTAGFIDRDA